MELGYGLLFGVFALLGGGCWLLVRFAKTNGATETTLTETEADLKAVTAIMKEAKENEALRDKTYRNTLSGNRPASLRKYDRKV